MDLLALEHPEANPRLSQQCQMVAPPRLNAVSEFQFAALQNSINSRYIHYVSKCSSIVWNYAFVRICITGAHKVPKWVL